MITTSTSPASPGSPRSTPRAERNGDPAQARDKPRVAPAAAESFARLLRAKQHAPQDEARDGGPGSTSCAAPMAMPLWPRPLATAPAPAAGGVDLPSATQEKTVTAAQAAQPLAQPGDLAALRHDAGTWQLSIADPRGVAIELRAQKAEGWTLTIGSPVADAELLARHAPRLNERLRARQATHSHVRIEDGGAPRKERE